MKGRKNETQQSPAPHFQRVWSAVAGCCGLSCESVVASGAWHAHREYGENIVLLGGVTPLMRVTGDTNLAQKVGSHYRAFRAICRRGKEPVLEVCVSTDEIQSPAAISADVGANDRLLRANRLTCTTRRSGDCVAKISPGPARFPRDPLRDGAHRRKLLPPQQGSVYLGRC